MDEHQRLADACTRLLIALDCDIVIDLPAAMEAIAEVAEQSSPSEPVLVAMFGAVRKAALR